jgi:uncharacterized protein (DUF362 family)
MAETPQRTLYSITDAVVVGEGLGPLAPEPKALNLITCASSSPAAELMHAALMGFDWEKIPLIAHSFDQFRYPLTSIPPDEVRLCTEEGEFSQQEVSGRFAVRCAPAPGWVGHIEQFDGPGPNQTRDGAGR